MRLWIAEKYELAEVIAKNLGNPRRAPGHFVCGSDRVVPCAGHMLELCEPQDYDEVLEQWKESDLPIVMVPWKYKPIANRRKQLGIIRDLIKDADEIVHAGDADDEGQLLVDEILTYYQVKKPVRRVLINDYNDKLVKNAIANLKDNRDFQGMSRRALARSVADLHWGVNMSRLYALSVEGLPRGVPLSVGRVQTPILGLVVNQDRAVESHQESFHYTLQGAFTLSDTTPLVGKLVFPDSVERDEKGRLLSPEPLKPIQQCCDGQTASVVSAERSTLHTPPPLPYDLLDLQADASRLFKYSARKTLQTTQSLRGKHALITYNRSDCRYLSEEKHGEAPAVLGAVQANVGALSGAVSHADASIKNRAFNSANVGAHHAIIPTEKRTDLAALDEAERNIYWLVCRAYVAQFWPNKVTDTVAVLLACGGYRFKVSASRLVSPGWEALYKNESGNQDDDSSEGDGTDRSDMPEVYLNRLAQLQPGDPAQSKSTEIKQHKVPAPKYYTEATLLKDLRSVAKYVNDPRVAALLKAKDKGKKGENGGIGTPATRDSFIETLLKRNFIEKKRGKLISTPLGRAFYDVLPDIAKHPDMTALWHEQQLEIEAGRLTVEQFLEELIDTIDTHVQEIRTTGLDGAALAEALASQQAAKAKASVVTDHACGECGKPLVRREAKAKRDQTKGKKSRAAKRYWYGCTGFPDCKQTYPEFEGAPDFEGQVAKAAQARKDVKAVAVGDRCPECDNGDLVKRDIKSGPNAGKPFIGCTGFPKCKFFRWYG